MAPATSRNDHQLPVDSRPLDSDQAVFSSISCDIPIVLLDVLAVGEEVIRVEEVRVVTKIDFLANRQQNSADEVKEQKRQVEQVQLDFVVDEVLPLEAPDRVDFG